MNFPGFIRRTTQQNQNTSFMKKTGCLIWFVTRAFFRATSVPTLVIFAAKTFPVLGEGSDENASRYPSASVLRTYRSPHFLEYRRMHSSIAS